jgi:hypothetical protein
VLFDHFCCLNVYKCNNKMDHQPIQDNDECQTMMIWEPSPISSLIFDCNNNKANDQKNNKPVVEQTFTDTSVATTKTISTTKATSIKDVSEAAAETETKTTTTTTTSTTKATSKTEKTVSIEIDDKDDMDINPRHLPLFVYEEWDQNCTSTVEPVLLQDNAPFAKSRQKFVKCYHVIQVSKQQLFFSYDAHKVRIPILGPVVIDKYAGSDKCRFSFYYVC